MPEITRRAKVSTVEGRVLNAATKVGIPGLIVTVRDVNPGRATRRENAPPEALIKTSTRMGSVETDDSGTFMFSYDGEDIAALGEDRFRANLLLTVAGPDVAGGRQEEVLHVSRPRNNAGHSERYTIEVPAELLAQHEITSPVTVKTRLDAYEKRRADEVGFSEGVADLDKAAVQADTTARDELRAEIVSAIATDVQVATLPGEVLTAGDTIKGKVDIVSNRAVGVANKQVGDTRGVRVNLFLTNADRLRLAPFFANAVNGFATIPEHELQDILFRRNSTENPGTLLVHNNPIVKYCSERGDDEVCAQTHTGLKRDPDHDDDTGADTDTDTVTDGNPGAGTDANGDGNGDSAPTAPSLTNLDIPQYAARLLSGVPDPGSVFAGENTPADHTDVDGKVNGFALRAGPADVPAFYDFQSLDIAFEHVWQLLLDEELIDTAHAADRAYRTKTGLSLSHRFSKHWAADLAVGPRIYDSFFREVPADVIAAFDISIEEWLDLSANHQTRLLDIARKLAGPLEIPKLDFGGGFFGSLGTKGPRLGTREAERRRQELREQGERIIDSVRHDDYYTLHKTLRELQSRVSSNYEFTVFAADRNSHSVNFGLLNTFRQQWTPINYQAGRLVKTLPLAPKEERKYSVKITRNLKRAQKEAIKNNSSVTSEQASTARVEAEIMEKALTKTSFNLTAEGTYNIGVSKGKSTTTFGVEAQQESSGTRKDFREAVLKAVQDYKQETSVQVDTESVDTAEFTESGTLTNWSDEVSATYLFFDLQRRFRVSEQLYRVQPVVLVAQEMPAPHQITESWVISHDWILNRSLLDDSFQPALTYLANKSVGDDFALRELRKNLRQQRNLVETLRIELAIAGHEAENRYRGLEAAIEARIGEEEAESTDGWFSDVGDFFGGGGQDPEAAKARELAAKDAHQYATEKAEKAAAAMRQEVSSLHAITAQYNQTLREHLDNDTRVKRLLVHIRNNIFYYMQAIWSMEPPDQRFLRLHKVQVPQLDLARVQDPGNPNATLPDRSYEVEVPPVDDIFHAFREPGTTKHRAFMSGRLQPVAEYKPLVEVADLDSLLGFKGNYMIFPLKAHNALTEFMAAPYVDAAFGAMDPDELSNVSLTDYSRYVCCLHKKLPADRFEAIKPQLRAWLELLLADPLRNGDEIVVPTGSLFVEALLGATPLIEAFKLKHRELDVRKVQEEVRQAGLESLRMAARIINDERGDPSIEKQILIGGAVDPVIDVDGP